MYIKSFITQTAKDVLIRFPKKIVRLFSVVNEMQKFNATNDGRFSVKVKDIYPCLKDKISTTPFDQHYIYHPAWAARILAQTKPIRHTDFSSILSFSSIISAFIPTTFYDYRPAALQLDNLESKAADLTNLPIANASLSSISCMHTIEHIGLGRYGDAIDPSGDIKAAIELQRIVSAGGDILFVTPVGKQRIEFNAHRVYAYETVLNLFSDCMLQEFSLIPDSGGLITNANPVLVQQQQYGCGCFWFKKKTSIA